jgi:WD40 repeat protein
MPDIVWSETGHLGAADATAFAPNGRTVASGGGEDDSTVKVWDADHGDLLRELPGHHFGVISLDFSPDGTRLAAGHVRRIDFPYVVFTGAVYVWDVEEEQILHEFVGGFVEFSADGTRLLSSGYGIDRYLRVHTLPDGAEIANIYTGDYVGAAALSADGQRAASGRYEGLVQLWDVNTEQLLDTFDHGSPVHALAFAPDGAWLASGGHVFGGGSTVIKIWNTSTGELVHTLAADDTYISEISISADGATLIASGTNATVGRMVRLWRIADGAMLAVYDGEMDPYVTGVDLAASGTRFVYTRGDGVVVVANTALPGSGDMNCDGVLDFGDINPFALALSSPDGYAAAFPGCDRMSGDVNGDSTVGFGDINAFVALLSGE